MQPSYSHRLPALPTAQDGHQCACHIHGETTGAIEAAEQLLRPDKWRRHDSAHRGICTRTAVTR